MDWPIVGKVFVFENSLADVKHYQGEVTELIRSDRELRHGS